jgi:hypothetical protein
MEDCVNKGRIARGEKIKNSILTEFDVLAIRELSSNKVPNNIIAEAFGIRTEHVRAVVRRDTWGHI